MSKDLFLRMSEEYYLNIPEDVRERFIRDKVYGQSDDDFDELMKYPDFKKAYENNKESKKQLEEIKYKIREQWRGI